MIFALYLSTKNSFHLLLHPSLLLGQIWLTLLVIIWPL